MKRANIDDYVYRPKYKTYDMRSGSEKTRELATLILMYLLIIGGFLIGSSLLLLMVTKNLPLVYWPVTVLHFISKWATIIGWPIWLIVEITGLVKIAAERHEDGAAYDEYMERIQQERNTREQ